MNNIHLTQDPTQFDIINAPKVLLRSIDFQVPKNLVFNHTYYIYRNEELVAFRILAYSLCREDNQRIEISYLTQLPNCKAKWLNSFINTNSVIFDSVEDFIKHQVTGKHNVYLNWSYFCNVFNLKHWETRTSFEGKVWVWDKYYNCPKNNFQPMFERLVVTENGLNVCFPIEHETKYYLSKEECIKDTLNALKIVDFNDVIDWTFTSSAQAPKIHILRFVEE